MKKKLLEVELAQVSPASTIVLNDLIQSMYKAAMKLQEIQTSYPTPISRAAILGMSADISAMLVRFRKIAGALKSGDDKKIEKSIAEARLRKIISDIIAEELKR